MNTIMKSRLSKRESQCMKENNVTENFVCQIDNLRNNDFVQSLTNFSRKEIIREEKKLMRKLNKYFMSRGDFTGIIHIIEFCPVSQKFNVFRHLTQFTKDNFVFVESELN